MSYLAVKYGDYNGQETLRHYAGSADGYTIDGYAVGPSNHTVNEPFTVQEVRLMRQVSGFGFRIIGGKEEGSQVRTDLTRSEQLGYVYDLVDKLFLCQSACIHRIACVGPLYVIHTNVGSSESPENGVQS